MTAATRTNPAVLAYVCRSVFRRPRTGKSGLARSDRSAALLTAAVPRGRVRPVSRQSRVSWPPPAAASPAEHRLARTRNGGRAGVWAMGVGVQGEEAGAVRVALAEELGGIGSVKLGELPDPVAAAGQALVRVHGAGVGPWDVGFLGGGFPGIALPFVPGQEIAGVVEAAGEGAGVRPGERVYASLFPAGGGFAELALAWADRLAPMPAPGELRRGGRAGDRRRDRLSGPG